MTGPQIKTRRQSLGLTQSQLGDYLRVSPNTVARWERGEMAIPAFLDLAIQTIERSLSGKKGPGATLPAYVRTVIQETGLTYREISNRARSMGFKIAQGALSDLVMGRIANPSLKFIKALAAGLDRPERDLLEAAGINTGADEGGRDVYISLLESPRFTTMASAFERLTPEQKREAEPMVAQLEKWINSKFPRDEE